MEKSNSHHPPGRIKIMNALSSLMKTKDFHSITTAQIAGEAGVTEGLIYKYFKDKKDLLYQVLEEHFESFQLHIESKIKKQASSLEKLSLIIQETLKSYAENRVFAKILLLEVRSSPEYFNCSAYRMVRRYSSTILEIIQQGIKTGEIARDINPAQFRQVILGSIEHACLGDIIFEREIDSRAVSKNLCKILFRGVMP